MLSLFLIHCESFGTWAVRLQGPYLEGQRSILWVGCESFLWETFAPSGPSLTSLQVPTCVRERLGFGSICLPQGAGILRGTVLGRGDYCPPQPGCRDPHAASSHTLCVFPDRPAHLGHAIPGVLLQGGQQPQGKQGALRAHVRFRCAHVTGLGPTNLASQTSLCQHLWECDQALSAGDKNMDTQFPQLCQS